MTDPLAARYAELRARIEEANATIERMKLRPVVRDLLDELRRDVDERFRALEQEKHRNRAELRGFLFGAICSLLLGALLILLLGHHAGTVGP